MIYYNLCIFLLFLIYSMLGYIIEVTCVSIIEKKFTPDRGFLIGPYLPIFGVGSIIITMNLQKYENDYIVLFVMSAVLCCLLEYLTSLLLEKIFNLRWWDYSDKSFNLNGRICLSISVLFGLGGVFIIKIINPIFVKFIHMLPEMFVIILGTIVVVAFIIDFFLTLYIMFRLKSNANKYTSKNTNSAAKAEVRKSLHKHSFLTTRLLNAFPQSDQRNNKDFAKFKELIYQIREEEKHKHLKKKK